MAIFGYIGALIVEAVTHGVVTGAISERRRRRAIEQLRNHYIIRGRTGALIIALRKRDGTFDATPEPAAVIDDGDVTICVGTPAEPVLLEELFASNQAVAR